MGFAEFIKNRFLGAEICVSIDNGESETITLEQSWIQNREFFQGIVKDVVDGILILSIGDEGEIYIEPSYITHIWQKPLDPIKVMRNSLTKKMNAVGKTL